MQPHAAMGCTCSVWAGWAPFLQSLFFLVEEPQWGNFWKAGSGGRSSTVEQRPRSGPKTAAGRKTRRKRVDKTSWNPLKREGVGTQVENGFPQTCLHQPKTVPKWKPFGKESETVRKRFQNTGREPFWIRFGTVSEPFPDHVSFWGTLFGTVLDLFPNFQAHVLV